MGMYTEILFRAEMSPVWDEDRKVKLAVSVMRDGSGPDEIDRAELPDHPLFDCRRWSQLAMGGSYYFPLANHEEWRDDFQGGTYWSFRANLKDYDDEIEKFFDWISPYTIGCGDFLGYSLYEEGNTPRLFFRKEDAA